MKRIIPLNKNQIALVEENVSIIKQVIFSRIIYDNNSYGLEYDDLFQEGAILLCNAAIKYDKNKNDTFKFFAYKVVLNGLISYCKKINKNKKNKLLYNEKIKNTSQTILYEDIFLQEKIDEVEVLFFLENIKKEYSGTVALGIEALMWKIKGFNGTEIAKIYNIKPSLVGARISRAVKKLKENSVFILYMENFLNKKLKINNEVEL